MEERILVLRAGIGSPPPRSREAVARILDVSPRGVRRLERRALRRLRSLTRARSCAARAPGGPSGGESTSTTTLTTWGNVALVSPFAAGGARTSPAMGSDELDLANLVDTLGAAPPASAQVLPGGAAQRDVRRNTGGGFPLAATFGIGLLAGALVLGCTALLARRERDAQDAVVTTGGAVAAAPPPAERMDGDPRPAGPAVADERTALDTTTNGGAVALAPHTRRGPSADRPAKPGRPPERSHLTPVPAPREPEHRGRPGARPTIVGGGRFGRRRERVEGAETCTIEWRPEYVTSRFRAVLEGGTGPRATIAESDVFRWPPTKPPEPTAAVRAAHDSLVEQLAELGWEPDAQADPDAWFAQRFSLAEQPARRRR